jgi:flagellar biosynthesis protein
VGHSGKSNRPSPKAEYRRAVALSYEGSGHDAPNVSLKAEQLMADELVRIAERYAIPVVERPGLAQALSRLEIDQEIPPDLYKAVAIVLNEIDRSSR